MENPCKGSEPFFHYTAAGCKLSLPADDSQYFIIKPFLWIGFSCVSLALISYRIGIFSGQRSKQINHFILSFPGQRLLLDLSGTICMIEVSSNSPFTYHGIIGYSALFALLMDNILLRKIRIAGGNDQPVPDILHKYSRQGLCLEGIRLSFGVAYDNTQVSSFLYPLH